MTDATLSHNGSSAAVVWSFPSLLFYITVNMPWLCTNIVIMLPLSMLDIFFLSNSSTMVYKFIYRSCLLERMLSELSY
jgi:hypothetical protein